MEYYANTDIGKMREKNQDQAAVLVNNKDQILGLVCDGMGGHKAGEIASHVAKEHIISCFRVNPPFISDEEVKEWLQDTVLESHQIVKRMASMDKDTEGMGTTVAMAVIYDDQAFLCHVGDSRIYICDNEDIYQVTKDHTLVNELVKRGAISQEAAKTHSQKNVLIQAVGADMDIHPTISQIDIQNKDVLICSDGLYNSIDESMMFEIMRKKLTVQEKVEAMIDLANQNGGRDNIAVVIVEHKGGAISE